MKIRQLNPKVLAVVIVLIPVNQITLNYLFSIGFFSPLSEATHHWIQPTLAANLISLVVFSALIFGWGRLDLPSVMVTRKKLISGIKWGFVSWMIMQGAVAVSEFTGSGSLTFNNDLNVIAGRLIGQLFGNAALEELLYRGLFILQFYMILRVKVKHRTAVVLAVVLSQLIFALIHLPNRILLDKTDNLWVDQIRLFSMGILFAIMFIRTANLPFLIVVHALLNAPTLLVGHFEKASLYILLIAVILTTAWPKLVSKKQMLFWPDKRE